MRILGVIPARGGSKRFPRKNIVPFLGRPAIVATIDAARESGVFTRWVVSTEDEEIRAVARAAGAETDRRPSRLSTDAATIAEVALELLEREEAAGTSYDAICVLYATAVLRDAADIRATCALLSPGTCDFSQAVCRYEHYAHQALQLQAGAFLFPMWPEVADLRSSELPTLVCGNGSTYAATVPAFRAARTFLGPRMRGYEMPRWKSVDLDYPDDLALAEFYATRMSLKNSSAA